MQSDLERYKEKMGNEFGPVFYALHIELTNLYLRLKEYRELFASNTQRIDLLNATAPAFFSIASEAIAIDMMLRISAITDKKKSAGRDNLTIRKLLDLVNNELKANLEPLVADAVSIGDVIRALRNKALAHHDLKLKLGEEAAPRVIYPHVTTALLKIADALNAIRTAYGMAYVRYEQSVQQTGGAIALLGHLYTSTKRREKWDQGEINEDEIPPQDL